MASIGRSGKSKLGLAGNGIQEYESVQETGIATIGSGLLRSRNDRPPRATKLPALSIYGNRCFMAYTIIFLGMHFLRCVFTSISLDISWLVPHDRFGLNVGFHGSAGSDAGSGRVSHRVHQIIGGNEWHVPGSEYFSPSPYQLGAKSLAMIHG